MRAQYDLSLEKSKAEIKASL